MDALALPDTGVLVALCIAAAMAGWVDAVSGGGGLLQLPALLVAFPSAEPVEALGTNKVSSVLGTAAATATYARKAPPDVRTALPMAVAAFIGAGGLGERIVTGLALNDSALMLAGALPAAGLALCSELLFESIDRYLRRSKAL